MEKGKTNSALEKEGTGGDQRGHHCWRDENGPHQSFLWPCRDPPLAIQGQLTKDSPEPRAIPTMPSKLVWVNMKEYGK